MIQSGMRRPGGRFRIDEGAHHEEILISASWDFHFSGLALHASTIAERRVANKLESANGRYSVLLGLCKSGMLLGRLAPIGSGLVFAALLCSCADPTVSAPTKLASQQKARGICGGMMSFDVSGPYYAACRDYLRRHADPSVGDVSVTASDPPEHRACQTVGLTKGTAEYDKCVQQMYQLDISSVHL
jgi:hypothetical protein